MNSALVSQMRAQFIRRVTCSAVATAPPECKQSGMISRHALEHSRQFVMHCSMSLPILVPKVFLC